jgi:hypothetical protein
MAGSRVERDRKISGDGDREAADAVLRLSLLWMVSMDTLSIGRGWLMGWKEQEARTRRAFMLLLQDDSSNPSHPFPTTTSTAWLGGCCGEVLYVAPKHMADTDMPFAGQRSWKFYWLRRGRLTRPPKAMPLSFSLRGIATSLGIYNRGSKF